VCPKCPGSEVREEYKRGFGVPTLIAVHPENDPKEKVLNKRRPLLQLEVIKEF
jgi:ketol-acid reductoisomerase